tara:strand:+ start:11932 stop:12537 length:606 start_codon:yes stop_codon:yes gene_type:complete
MKHSPWKVVQMFEESVAEYCGAKYAVAIDNCTDALMMCCQYLNVSNVTIPARTYLSVPQSIMSAGGAVKFKDYAWKGIYQLEPYPIYDAAKRFTSNMYQPGAFMCLSFHHKKILKIGKGGMILTDNKEAADWFKKCRYEGRDHVADDIALCGWNAYMTPETAARGLTLLQTLPEHNDDQIEEPNYRDLRTMPLFKNCEVVK